MLRHLTVPATTLALGTALFAPAIAAGTAPGTAYADEAAPAAAPTIAVSLARTSAPLGTKVVLSGTARGTNRTLHLQTRDARGRWRTLATKQTTSGGAFRFTTPTWNRTHPLRVTDGTTRSAVVKLKRIVPATTGGKASAWKPVYDRVHRWDPCTTHTVRIRTKGAPKWFKAEVKSALRNNTLYTGIPFRYAGTTKRTTPSMKTDIVISWTNASKEKRLRGSTAGLGGSWKIGNELFAGMIVLDKDEKISRNAWRAVLRHELAHVVGLDHVNDRKQRMYPSTDIGGDIAHRSRTWGRGDVAGLKRVGATHGCVG